MIETREGYENIEAIINTPGIGMRPHIKAHIETGQQCLLLTNTLSRYHITPTQTKPPGHEECNRMEGVVILVFRVVIAK